MLALKYVARFVVRRLLSKKEPPKKITQVKTNVDSYISFTKINGVNFEEF